ncbi:phosphoserine phosphatase SerB [Candidatus Bathyarchaeota archaeon]|nr:phosphoserine phosphatase SerB [Candidatus Bathyarchaeota archaeon]MBS7630475.1 phosphoserine phosphatase SerB [Candidatus Bathyarchaeota archaeon]
MLIAFDLEGTLLDGELFPEMGRALNIEALREITLKGIRGELSFEESLFKRINIIKGVPIEDVKEICRKLSLNRGVKETIKELKDLGCIPTIITGGFDILAERVARELDIGIVYSNRFLLTNGRITSVKKPIVTPEMKAKYLIYLSKKFGFGLDRCIAVGDGANDIPMMKIAGLSIAFHAKDCVKAKAKIVVNDDLNGIIPHVKQFIERATQVNPLFR